MKLQPGMVDAAIAGGVRHFYPSELGTDISYGAIGKKVRRTVQEAQPGFADDTLTPPSSLLKSSATSGIRSRSENTYASVRARYRGLRIPCS
jgi:hypothetical protein